MTHVPTAVPGLGLHESTPGRHQPASRLRKPASRLVNAKFGSPRTGVVRHASPPGRARFIRDHAQPGPWEAVVHDVSALLHAGVPAARAWHAALAARLCTTGAAPAGPMSVMLAQVRLTGSVDDAFTAVAQQFPERHTGSVFRQARLIWRVTTNTGSPSATTLARVAEQCQWAAEIAALQRSMLAGPRATLGVLAALLVVGWGGGYALGADPLAVLFGTLGGWALVCVGAGFAAVGLWWGRRMVRWALTGRHRSRQSGHSTEVAAAQVCDLVAVALKSGAPLDRAVGTVADALADCALPGARVGTVHDDACGAAELRTVLRYRRVGMPWASIATETPTGAAADLSRVLGMTETTGAAAADVLTALSHRLRQQALADARERASALGVKLALPLGLGSLPAYMCWVLAPTLWSLLGGIVS